MVTALVARIIEDPQLQDEPINLSWTTTVGEVCIDIPRLLVEFSQVWNFLMEYGVSFLFTKGIFPKVFHDTGAFNVNPAYYNSTLLDLLVHDGGCVKHSFKMRKQMVIWCKKLGYRMRRVLTRLTRRWISSTRCGRGKLTCCTLEIQATLPGPTIVKGLRMRMWKWEEKRHSSSLKTTLSRKSKSCTNWACNLFLLRGTYSEYSYSIAVSMLEYLLNDNFDSLLSHYVFEPLDMVG